MTSATRRRNLLAIIGPGMIVAATGVGAGDLATGAFAGSMLGVAVLWAVVLAATFKFTVNEGLARWQLATGKTLLEGSRRTSENGPFGSSWRTCCSGRSLSPRP